MMNKILGFGDVGIMRVWYNYISNSQTQQN